MPSDTEAVVAITDYLLAVAAFAGALGLDRARERRDRISLRFWATGFLAAGAAALLGGSWHGFSHRLPDPSAALLWKATLAAAGLAGFLLAAGAAFASLPRRAARAVAMLAAVKLAVYLVRALPGGAFDAVVVDSVATLAAIVLLQALAYVRRRAPSAPWVLAGAAVSAGAAAIEALRPSFPPPFGPDAAYHLVQIAGLYFFYRGGGLFDDL